MMTIIYRCPVCSTSLADLGLPAEQEAHVRNCLEGGAGTTPETAKYLVYKLPAESALLGVECKSRPCVTTLRVLTALQVSFA
jgi:hypothetical protein